MDKISVVNHKNNSSYNVKAWRDLGICKTNEIEAELEYNGSVAKSTAFIHQQSLVQTPVLLFINCVTVDKFPNFP